MKIVILGNVNSPMKGKKEPYSWFVKTFKQGCEILGHDVYGINYRTNGIPQIMKIVSTIKPQIMFTHLSFHPIKPVDQVLNLYKNIRDKFGTKIIHVLADARHEPRYKGNIEGAFDMAFVSQKQNLKKFEKYWGIPTFFCPYSCMHQTKLAKPAPDLSFDVPIFTGSPNSHHDRSDYISRLMKIMPLKIFQTQSGQDLRHRTEELSISAKCILGLCTGYDIGHYIDVRPFQYLGAGACMIIRKFKNMDDIIPDDIYYPFDTYNNPQEVKDIFNNIIMKTDATPMRKKAFKYMQETHSCVIRMRDVISVIMECMDDMPQSYV